jgi:hypothetical protein
MKRVTFNETTHVVMIENREDIQDKRALWWTYIDYIVFRERNIMEQIYLFTVFDDDEEL